MAEYKIISDSSCELPQLYRGDTRFELAPFRVEIDGVPIRDTADINTKTLLNKIVDSKTFAALACPAPDVFYNCIAHADARRVYLITISSKISGCYFSAMLAKKLYEEAHGDKQIFVIDSKSASGGECQLALWAMELEEQGLAFDEIKKQLISARDRMRTVVMMESFSALYKNVSFMRIKEAVSKAPNIKSIFMGEREPEDKTVKSICLKENWNQLVENIAGALKDASEQTRIVITHCNNLIGAEKLRDMLMEKTGLKNFIIMSTSGLSSTLACDGGIIVTF